VQAMARRTLVSSLVLLLLLILALALWEIRLVVLLFLLAVVIASAMRPGVDALRQRGVPRGVGIAVHYAAVAALVGVLLFFAVPRALSEVQGAISSLPETRSEIHEEAAESTGLKHDVLIGLERRLAELPSRDKLVEPGVEVTRGAVEGLVAIFFVFAAAAYWISERDRVEQVFVALLPKGKRGTARKTWQLIDLKLGAFVRGQLLLMLLVGTVLSLAFWAIGLPYWLLVGTFAGVVEIVPVIGPLAAGALAVGVGLTASVTTAVCAGAIVLIVRLVEDYLVMPRVLGDAVGLSPLLVLVAVAACGVVFGGLAVLLAIPVTFPATDLRRHRSRKPASGVHAEAHRGNAHVRADVVVDPAAQERLAALEEATGELEVGEPVRATRSGSGPQATCWR
jgi:predicted PurR-regulated permease PerM